jgi:arylsulfatase
VIDVVPTLYEAIGITPPTTLNGIAQKPIEGISFAYTFDGANARERHRTQYFEMGANRGLYHDGWMASALSFVPWIPVREAFDLDKEKWELYNVDKDFSQANDLAASNPQKLRELQDLWWSEAAKYNVLPMDWRVAERFNSELAGRPSLGGNAKTITYYAGQIGLPPDASPRILNKSWTVTADIENASRADGMVVTQGGTEGGYGLYLRQGKPTFVYNLMSIERTTIASNTPVPTGKVQIALELTYEGAPREVGKPAALTMRVNGATVAQGRLTRTIPAQISIVEGLDVGEDVGSAVDFSYRLPFKFTGTIDKVTFVLK